ncbi:MAG: hypothetical protein P4L71_10440 [Acetobacteraceae bacterium]|nr:hypothetical protein [Acetobacteraceae bacterium]
MEDRPDTCRLEHKVFAMFDSPLFRCAETDQMPVMTVRLGEREVAMPLRSLAREFNIPEDSSDGRMLALIAEALAFVAGLRIGDKLPSEVLTGAASWEPGEEHVRIANARLQIELVDWLHTAAGTAPLDVTPENLVSGNIDATVRTALNDALARAAEALGLPNGEAVLGKIEDLAQELAYIEALRDRLLGRVQAMAVKLERLAQLRQKDGAQTETLTRVRQLSVDALKQLRQRFEEQDAHIGEVMSALRHIESHRSFIRGNRDWLYRSQRGWEPILQEWDVTEPKADDSTRILLTKTYHFLAPRFMPITEWVSALRPAPKAKVRGMVW